MTLLAFAYKIGSAIYNSVFFCLLLTGIHMNATFFAITAHVQNDASTFTLFETEPGVLSKPVEVVFDVNHQKIALFESDAEIETVALKAIFLKLVTLLPQVQLMAKKFLKNYLSERIQASSHN